MALWLLARWLCSRRCFGCELAQVLLWTRLRLHLAFRLCVGLPEARMDLLGGPFTGSHCVRTVETLSEQCVESSSCS
jgi:hypothetical protein